MEQVENFEENSNTVLYSSKNLNTNQYNQLENTSLVAENQASYENKDNKKK